MVRPEAAEINGRPLSMAASGDRASSVIGNDDCRGTGRMKSQEYSSELLRSLHVLKANDELCDFTVCAGGKYIQVKQRLIVWFHN